MRKYSDIILESNLPKHSFVFKLATLKDGNNFFLIYKFGLFDVINKLLTENSTPKNANPEYQLPLSLLFKTGKYSDIKNVGGEYRTDKLSNISCVLNEKGEWHPVNKLNTNSFDQAELLYDLFTKIGVYPEIPTDEVQLMSWLMDFKSKNDLYKLIKENLNFKDYIKWNRKFSADGDIAEEKVASILTSKGCEILYQGGDGDFVDMIYGTDLIVSKNDKIYTVQVKTKEGGAKSALNKAITSNGAYSKIDWFCSPTGSNIIVFTKGNANGKVIS